MMVLKSALLGISALALAIPAAANAAPNIVTNGDFSTNSFAGYTQFGNTGFTYVSNGVAYFGPVGSPGGINLDLTTIAGKSYLFSFDLGNNSGGGGYNTYAVSFNGKPISFASFVGDTNPIHYMFNVKGTGSDRISFAFQNDPSYFNLDNISVAAVPEPATWLMLIGGFGIVGGAMRRRKSAVRTAVAFA